jgi:hypothetical protein
MSIRVTDNCKNIIDSYGEICVYCNLCGRFSSDPERKKQREEIANKLIEYMKEQGLDDPKNYPLL